MGKPAQMGPRVPCQEPFFPGLQSICLSAFEAARCPLLLTLAETLFLSLCLHLPTTCRAWETFSERC